MSAYVTLRVIVDPAAIAQSNGPIADRWIGGDGECMPVEQWPDAEGFQAVLEKAGPVSGPVTQTTGVTSRPEVNVWRGVDIDDAFGSRVPQRRLRWQGNVGADWLFAGDRDFVIDAADDGAVRFTHVEDVRGILFPVFRLSREARSSDTTTGSTPPSNSAPKRWLVEPPTGE